MSGSKITKVIAISLAIILTIACCMLPRSYKGSIEQSMQEGLIIYDNGTEDLILKVSPQISGENAPKNFCWLITVPNEPTEYNVVKPEIFDELYNLKRDHLLIPRRHNSLGRTKSEMAKKSIPGVELGARVKVGAYDIQPVRGVGENAFNGLNDWLQENGFPTEPEDHMKYFIDNKFTFLCIKVNPADQEQGVDNNPDLKPLHMIFKSDRVYYPMKYSSQQGDFSVNLYTLTSTPIDYLKSDATLKRINWVNQGLYKNVDIKDKTFEENLEKIVKGKGLPHLYLNNFRCAHPNKNKAIEKWTEDVFLSLTNAHTPDEANQMKRSSISWPRTILLVLAILLTAVFVVQLIRS